MLTEKDVIIDCDESGTRTVTVKGKTVFSGSHPTFLVDVDDSRILLQCLEPSTEAFVGTAWKSYRVSLQESPVITVSEVAKDLLADNKWLRKRLNELEVNKDSLTLELKVVREERDRLNEIFSSAMLSIKNYGSHPSVEAHQCPMDVPVNNLPATEKMNP